MGRAEKRIFEFFQKLEKTHFAHCSSTFLHDIEKCHDIGIVMKLGQEIIFEFVKIKLIVFPIQ